MARCAGTTKAGDRCKRGAIEGSEFCPSHQDQSGDGSGGGSRSERRGADLILIGAVALALMALRRVIRL